MKREQGMEEHDHKAQTCDMWGHVIKEPLPTKADDRPKATPVKDVRDNERVEVNRVSLCQYRLSRE